MLPRRPAMAALRPPPKTVTGQVLNGAAPADTTPDPFDTASSSHGSTSDQSGDVSAATDTMDTCGDSVDSGSADPGAVYYDSSSGHYFTGDTGITAGATAAAPTEATARRCAR
jgi:hypothetical protein